MKATLITLALVISATTASVYAAVPEPTGAQNTSVQQAQPQLPNASSVHGKTHAEVRHELDLARKDGELAALNKFYQGS